MEYFLSLKGEQVGPYKIEDIKGWLNAGHIKGEDLVWFEGSDGWIPIKSLPLAENASTGHATESELIPPFEAYQGDQPYIFISYAHKDSEVVYGEITELHENGFNIWYDEGIEASNEWPEEIANAVIGCSVFLVFISPRSTASVNCRNEINLALNEGKPFLAIHLEESSLPPGLRLRMGDLQAILRFKLTKERYQKKLHGSLNQLLGIDSKRDFLTDRKDKVQESSSAKHSIQTPKINYHQKKGKKTIFKICTGFLLLTSILSGIIYWNGTGEEIKRKSEKKKKDFQQTAFNPNFSKQKSLNNNHANEGATVSIRTRSQIKIESMREGRPRLFDSKPLRKIEGFTRKLYDWKFTSIPQRRLMTFEIRVQKPGYVYCFGNPGNEAKIKQVFGGSFVKWESANGEIRGRMITSCFRKRCEAGEVLHLSGFEIQIAAAQIIIGS